MHPIDLGQSRERDGHRSDRAYRRRPIAGGAVRDRAPVEHTLASIGGGVLSFVFAYLGILFQTFLP